MPDISKRFGVPLPTIRRHAAQGDWMAKRVLAKREISQQVTQRAVAERVDTTMQGLRLADAVLGTFLRRMAGRTVRWNGADYERVDVGGPDITVADALAAIKLKLLIEGKATENVQITLPQLIQSLQAEAGIDLDSPEFAELEALTPIRPTLVPRRQDGG